MPSRIRFTPAPRARLAVIFCLLAALATPLAAPSPQSDAVFRPVFATPHGALRAGTAFVARLEGCATPILVTAMHLFGPGGGLDQAMTAQDVVRSVRHVELTGLASGARRLSLAVGSLTPADAKACCRGEPMRGAGDVAAFAVATELAAIALPLASDAPPPGARVTLLAEMADGPAAGLRHEATVLARANGFLYYRFDDPGLQTRATSGAPVIDAAGQVVAINVSSGHLPNDDPAVLIGGGNPVDAWRDAVGAACQAR